MADKVISVLTDGQRHILMCGAISALNSVRPGSAVFTQEHITQAAEALKYTQAESVLYQLMTTAVEAWEALDKGPEEVQVFKDRYIAERATEDADAKGGDVDDIRPADRIVS